jgi:uncharacterized alpha-E superfamily protein
MRRTTTNLGLRTTRHAPAGLISRVADNCFWFGRYLERTESLARQLQAHRGLAIDGELDPDHCWRPIVVVSGESDSFHQHFGEGPIADGDVVERYLVWDERCWVTLSRSVGAARENARAIREVLSGEVWETMNELHLYIQDQGRETFEHHRDDFYRKVRQMTQLVLGLMRSTMLHDTALDFVWLGVMLERTNQTARLLDVHHHTFAPATQSQSQSDAAPAPTHQVVETAVWLTLLRACSGLEPFLKSNAGRVTPAGVAHFLVADARFPRSITYGVHAAFERFAYIRPPADVDLPGGEALARLARLDAWLTSLPETHNDLHAVLTHIVDETAHIAATIGRELLGYGD